MRPIRVLATAIAAVALLTASVVVSPAGAATDGVGTASTSTKIVEVSVGEGGSVLNLGLLSDDARSTIDPAIASPEAFSRLLRLKLSSPLSAVNSLADGLPAIEARQPGGDQVKEVPGASAAVALPATPLTQAASIGSIQVDASRLTASLAAGSAESGLTAGVTAATVAGGLVSVNGAKVNLSTVSAPASASATRSASLDNVTVLDLGALLEGLGIDLSTLPLSSVSALLDQLGLEGTINDLAGVSITTTLQDLVDAINASIDTLQVVVDDTTGTLDQTVDDLLGLVGLTAPVAVDDALDAVQAEALIDSLQAELAELLETSLVALATAPLLQVGGVEVGLNSKAVSDVNASVATVTGKVGTVKVGTIELLGGTDLLAATDRVSAVVTDANTRISSALGAISPDLANLVKVDVLARSTSVTQSGDYVRSLAGITAASATITPPETLSALISALTAPAAESIGDLITEAGGTVPADLEPLMSGLQSVLTLGAGVLASPSTLTIGQVLGAAEYKAVAAPVTPTGGELPRTGGDSLLLLGGGAAVLALAARRLLRSSGLRTSKS